MAPFTSSEALRSRTESVNQAIDQARRTSLGQFFTAFGELRAGEGAILISRRGHLVRLGQSQTPVLVIEGGTADAPERPLVLLPCRKLEELERIVHEQTGGNLGLAGRLSFIVSGVVSQYRNENYLLLQRVELVKAEKNVE